MKKKELFAISLLSILVFVSFANVAVAAPPSYIGVKTGDKFIWTANLNLVNLNTTAIALIGEDNWTYYYNYLLEYFENSTGMEFDFFTGAGMKAVLKNVTDEMSHPYLPEFIGSGIYFDLYFAYAANNWTLVAEAANMTYPMVFLADPSTLNESNILYGVYGPPLFMPIGFNYSMYVDVNQAMIESSPYTNGNITIQLYGKGYKVTYKAVYLEYLFDTMGAPFEIGTLSDGVMTFTWNSIGVLNYVSLAYGGLTLATAQLVTADDGLIPGYELVTILGVSLTTFIALVYTIRKKKVLK